MWIVWLVIGLFIGWNLPQPDYAKNIQEKFVAMAKGAAAEAQKPTVTMPAQEEPAKAPSESETK